MWEAENSYEFHDDADEDEDNESLDEMERAVQFVSDLDYTRLKEFLDLVKSKSRQTNHIAKRRQKRYRYFEK